MRFRAVSVGVLLASSLGCNGTPPISPADGLYSVKGKIIQNGEPVGRGGLYIVVEEGGRGGCIFDAPVNDDGTFEARTSQSKDVPVKFYPGLPEGTYKVIFHPAGNGAKTGGQVEVEKRVVVEPKLNEFTIELPPRGSSKAEGIPRDDDPNSPTFNPNRDKK